MKQEITFNFSSPESSHGFLLYKLHTKWENGIKLLLRKYNLTHSQFVILTTAAWFVTFRDVPTQKELSEKTGIDVMTTSVVIKGLMKKGYILRITDKNDGRAYRISLSDEGMKLVKKSMDAVDDYDIEFFSVISQEEGDIFRKLMGKIVN